MRCEGKKISRACRQECCEPDGREKSGLNGREREWDEPDDNLEAVYDYDVNYGEKTWKNCNARFESITSHTQNIISHSIL